MQIIKTLKTICLCAALLAFGLATIKADTFFSKAATGDPALLTSWTNAAGANPVNFTSGDTFIIQSGHNYTNASGAIWIVNATTGGTAATVQINSGGALTFTLLTTASTLKLGGNLNQAAAGGIAGNGTAGTGIIEFTSNGSWTGSGDISTPKVSVVIDAGVTLDASGMSAGFKHKSSNTVGINVNGTLNTGTLTINGNANTSAFFTMGPNSTLITATTSASGLPGIFTGFSANKIILTNSASYVFNGAAAQVTGTTANNATMPNTVSNLTFNNSAGVTLSQATTVTNLTLTAGKVTGNVTISSGGSISGGSSTAYLNGQLTKLFGTAPSSASFTFPVGTVSAYSPVSIANFTDANPGNLTASATASQNPNYGTSGLDNTLFIARYWTLTGSGFSGSSSYDFTGTFVVSDNPNGANTASLLVRKWNGASWTAPGSSSSTSTTASGTSFSATGFGDFAAGQIATLPTVVSTTRSAITGSSATLGATVTANNGSTVTNYGIVWGTSPYPTLASNKVSVADSELLSTPFTANVTGLPAVTTIYYRGYAASPAGTGYSTNGSFLTLSAEPTVQASGVGISTRQNGNLSVSWTRGNGAKCIVLVKAGSAVDSDPVDGTTYTANAAFGSGTPIGSGNYVTYLNTGTNVIITGLAAGTTYHVAIYELNGSGGSENYLAPPARGSQTTVASPVSSLTWNGNADNDWNNVNNWDLLQVPDVGTPAIIPSSPANQPIYTNLMTTASFGTLTSSSALTVATNGFVVDGGGNAVLFFGSSSARLSIATNGVMSIPNGGMTLQTNGNATVDAGGTLSMSGTLIVGAGGNSSSGGGQGFFTNNSGTVSLGGIIVNNTGNNQTCVALINGGTNDLGAVTIGRSAAGSASALGTEGLIISNGLVRTTSIDVGGASGNSWLTMYLKDGLLTNTGAFTVRFQNTASRFSRFYQAGGVLVSTNTSVHLRGQTGANNGFVIYSVNGGTNMVGGFVLADSGDVHHSVFLTNSAKIYIGGAGIAMGGGNLDATNVVLTANGTFGALADWTNSVPMQIDGGTFNASDLDGNPHNIMIASPLRGSGDLTKAGNGILTLNATNTQTGAITINAGTLAVGANGAISTSSQFGVSSGATFDVSAKTGYTLGSVQTLVGDGSVVGNVIAAPGAVISAGTSGIGKLTFANSLSETNAKHTFELSATTNDSINVVGTLNLGGTNVITFVGLGTVPSGFYKIFSYGSLVGDVTNLSYSGAGYLTNNTITKTISLWTPGIRGATSIVWVGGSPNNWDILTSPNWKRLSDNGTEYYQQSDTVFFNAAGAANPIVNIVSDMQPSSVTVDAAANYTFSGVGALIGPIGLTKTNTGTLTVLTTNSYTGVTVISGGMLEAASIADATTASSIGKPGNTTSGMLVLDGGTLRYLGGTTSSDRGATFNAGGATVDITNAAAVLTAGGTITGAGSLTKTGPGALALGGGNNYSGGTTISNGTLQLNAATGAGSGGITNRGSQIKFGGSFSVGNQIEFTGNCVIDLNNPSGDPAMLGAWTGNGYVLVTNLSSAARTFTIGGNSGSSMAGFTGTVDMGNCNGFLRFNSDTSSPNTGSPSATFNLGTGGVIFNPRNGPVNIDMGELRGGSNTVIRGRASGTAGLVTYYIGAKNVSSEFQGAISNSTVSGSLTALTKVGTATLTLSGTINSYSGDTYVSAGTLQVDGRIINSAVTVQSYATLTGNGRLNSVDMNPYATLSPGVSGIGKLTINTLTLETSCTNIMELNKALGTNDAVVGLSSITYGGILNVVNLAGTLAAGDTFKLFDSSGGYSGVFDQTNLPALSGGLSWDASGLSVDGTIKVVTASFSSVYIDGSNLIMSGSNGVPSSAYHVLTSTNLELPLTSWTTNQTKTFNLDGSFSVTNAIIPGWPQAFYILKLLP